MKEYKGLGALSPILGLLALRWLAVVRLSQLFNITGTRTYLTSTRTYPRVIFHLLGSVAYGSRIALLDNSHLQGIVMC